jgi:hypothetical protein
MKNLIKILWANALLVMPFVSVGHPGHGHGNPLSPGHYLGNPEHAIPIALTLAIVGIYASWRIWRTRNEAEK